MSNKNAKKAAVLAKKLTADRDKIQRSADKIAKVLSVTADVVGGYKMVQKLRKQEGLFKALVDVMNDRIGLFEKETSSDVVETK